MTWWWAIIAIGVACWIDAIFREALMLLQQLVSALRDLRAELATLDEIRNSLHAIETDTKDLVIQKRRPVF